MRATVIAPEPTARRDWRAWAASAVDDKGNLRSGKLAELESALAELDPLHVRVRVDDLAAACESAKGAADGTVALAMLRGATERIAVESTWDDSREPEPRDWLVDQWLPAGRAGMLTGAGGNGKSTLAVMLACAVASGESDWLPASDPNVALMRAMTLGEPSAAVIASWEDEPSEGARRRYWMGRDDSGGLPYARASRIEDRLHWLDMRPHGPLWGPRDSGSGHVATVGGLTLAAAAMRRYCEAVGARLLIVDPLAAAYGGDENVRALVRAFMADSDAWAQRTGCAVMLIAHPPKGREAEAYSGSTDWHGAARFMWTLAVSASGYVEDGSGGVIFPADVTAPKGKGKAPKPADGMRLELAKSNYSRAGTSVWLRWRGKADAWEQCLARESAQARIAQAERGADASAPAKPNPSGNGDAARAEAMGLTDGWQ